MTNAHFSKRHIGPSIQEQAEMLEKIGVSSIEDLINQRNEARKNKDFKTADEIRDKLTELGIEIEDTPNGTIWRSI